MKAVFVKGEDRVSVEDIESPQIGEGDVVVHMRACGLCGSDLEKIYGHYGMKSGRLGHEPAGEIVDVGNKVRNFKVGDRVFVHHHVACYSCYYCLHGDYTMCDMYQKSNIDPCGLSERFLVPDWNISKGGLIKMPDSMSFMEASLIEPVACCLRALNKSNFQKGDSIAIYGAGPAGMIHVLLASAFGAGRIFVIDINQFRLNFATKTSSRIQAFNADVNFDVVEQIRSKTDRMGVDLTVLATGSKKAFVQAFEVTRKGGKVIMFGVPSKGSQVSLDLGSIYSNEQSLITSYAASEIETNQAIKLISEKVIDFDSLITHKFDIKNAADAIDCARSAHDAMKVVITNDI